MIYALIAYALGVLINFISNVSYCTCSCCPFRWYLLPRLFGIALLWPWDLILYLVRGRN